MADSGNGKVARGITIVLIALVLALMSGTAWNALASSETNQRVARLEANYETIREDLRDIKRAVGARPGTGER